MKMKSYAKVNLTLKIGQKLKSGYHKIESVMQPIDLYDNLEFTKLDRDEVVIESNNESIKTKDNLAYKAAMLLKKEYGVKHGARIVIEKNIPLAAGLGGGSSNAACALQALNSIWKLRIPPKTMVKHATALGSDVPFFLTHKPALVEGIGNKVKPITSYPKINAVIVNPGFEVSTRSAYQSIDRSKKKPAKKRMSAENYVKLMHKKDVEGIAKNMFNDFEPVVLKKHKALEEIYSLMNKHNAINACLSGSGPTVVGLFQSIYTAREAFFKLKDLYPFVYLTKTV